MYIVCLLQHFVLTKDEELKAGQENSMCLEGAVDSVLLVSCDRSSKQWKMSQVKSSSLELLLHTCRCRTKLSYLSLMAVHASINMYKISSP